ncbi:hypothetical protein KY341_03930, partial [Candidatus Woesearchaeota archaeon]|nr:hypothetical protein [Candidatus Woesearchaeota archaeon]
MGFAYNDLIPAAILLDNPGITREEFVNLLDNTRSAPMVFKKDYGEKIRRARWDTYYPRWEDKLFHRGLHGLAGLLHLEQKPAFEELQKSKNDENGLELRPPFLSVVPHKKNNKWLPPKFTVTVHEKYVFSKIHEKHEESWHKLQKGELFSDAYYHMYLMRVEDIIKEKHTPTKRSRKSREKEYPSPEYNYHLKVRYVRPLEKTYRFSSLDELVKAHPQFHYDFMYDFSQERGALYGGGLFQLG